jgi:dipeptidyl-peptidase-4
LISSEGKNIKNIMTSENKLADYKLGNMTVGTIKAADNTTDLYYRLITPPDFDPKKKYPTIVYVYGGPHAQLVDNSWLGGVALWDFYMAQEGYVMFTVDNRGSANRGFEFESVIHRQCGQNEAADQMKGVEFLKSLPYVDADRIGIHGWSYGGFMTITLATMFPETFKVAVAGGPVIDWKYYEVMYGERYMDTPTENPEGFKKTSLLNKAGNLKGRLLVIHGYVDPVVVPQNSLDFIKSCIAAGTDLDYFFYPNDEHNMRGATRVHLMKKVTRYFDDYLKPIK